MMVLLDSNFAQYQVARAELDPSLDLGQLLTPLTRYRDYGDSYAVENGAFAGFDAKAFVSLLERQKPHRDRCLWVNAPDVVGSARRTLEVFRWWYPKLCGWPLAFTLQNGVENIDIPWNLIEAVFVGGDDQFKLGADARHACKAAKAMGKWVHVGRVNSPERVEYISDQLGADSFDGTGISRYSHMRRNLVDRSPKLSFTETGAA